MTRGLLCLLLALPAATAFADAAAPPAWGACPDRRAESHGKLLLGRFADGVAVFEAEVSSSPKVARLWAHAVPGGTALEWPGGRPGVRHLGDKRLFGEAGPAAQAGKLFLWTQGNGWNGGDVVEVSGVELAKSLCDARDLVVYVVAKISQPGSGFAVASLVPPNDVPPADPVDTPRPVMNALWGEVFKRLQSGVRAQKLAPASLAVNVFPGKFEGSGLQYAVSVRWGNAFDDRFSVLWLADDKGNFARLLDQQEGGAGGTLIEVGDLDGDGQDELFYQVTTLDGSAAAVWSLKGGQLHALVQTTPVGE